MTRTVPVRVIEVHTNSGFDWGDAAIGAAGVVALAAIAFGLKGARMFPLRSVVVALVAAAFFAPSAQAQPTIQRMPFEDHDVSQSCGFPVQLDATGTAIDISYTDALGNFHEFQAGPQVKQTMTNLITGKTIVVNISGPGQLTFGADGSFTLVGTGLWSWTRVNPATLAPGIFLTQGRFVLSISASGVRTFTSTGTTIDLCAQLA